MNNELDDWQSMVMPYGNHLPIAGDATESGDGFADQLAALKQSQKPNSKASEAGKARQKQGNASEKRARRELVKMGMVHIQRIKTYYSRSGRYAIKAEADFRAIDPAGRYVLVEVKDITGETLPFSRIAKHQYSNLNTVHDAGGIALLIITHEKETAVLQWPVNGFAPRKSVKWADALEWRVNK